MKNNNKKKSAIVVDDKLKDLQSCISSLSIEDALKAVRLASVELEKVKEMQRLAEEKVKAASIDLEKSTTRKDELEKNLSSSSGQYSDASFWNDRYKETINNMKQDDNGSTYEWYVSFNDIKLKIDRDVLDSEKNYLKSIMVSGCGNSTLCEDLERNGFTNVTGTDYSKEALMIMIQRANDNNYKCKYIEADVCNMSNISNESYNIVIDKGTLDAIASANDENDTEKSLTAVTAYIREIWRVLVLKGKFIIITTMPETVFESIAMSTIDTVNVSNWSSCAKENLKTQMGGDVYYYCITKTSHLSKANATHKMSQKDVESGIQSLLDSAVKARNEFYTNDPESVEFQDGLNIQAQQMLSSSEPVLAVRVPMVRLNIIGQSASIKAMTVIDVEFLLKDGDWDDCDHICLVCVSLEGQVPLYNETDNQKYECFEYTSNPEQVNDASCIGYKGMTRIKLPPYGGYFVLTYMRGSNELARSVTFLTLAPVQSSHPDSRLNDSVRRRGVGPMNSNPEGTAINVIVEDLKNIKCVQISGTMEQSFEHDCTHHLSRIMSWIYQSPPATKEWNIAFESDVVCEAINRSLPSDQQIISKKTVYGIITVQDISISNLLIDEAYCEVDASGRIVCRIPYKDEFVDSYKEIEKSDDTDDEIDTEIYCRYCNQLLLQAGIKETRLLPSGILDNMMHEFFCSEEMPLQAMSSSELISSDSSLILGSIQVTVHPSNVKSNSLVLKCKTTATLIDFVHGYAGHVATSTRKTKRGLHSPANCESCLSRSTNLIDVDTCLLSCSRCTAYLGDGSISNDNYDETSKSSSFLLEDLQNIRFVLNSVTFRGHRMLTSHNGLKSVNLSVENVVARTLVHFANAYSVSSFCLYVGDDAENDTNIILIKVLSKDYNVMLNDTKLLFPSNSNDDDNGTCNSFNGIKLLYSYGKITQNKFSDVCKIPLQYDDLHSIKSLLSYRHCHFGQSVIKNFNVSCLVTT